MTVIDWNEVLQYMLLFAAIAFMTVIFMGAVAWWSVRRLRLPEGASFIEAMRVTPLPVVILLDLLDFFFDIFAAPVTWVLLGYLGLKPLRTVTVAEAVIPGTQLIPTMTLSWFAVRFLSQRRGGSPFVGRTRTGNLRSHTLRALPSGNRSLHRR